ncbi:hypothetical protein BT63DRAFT_411037 [Microthyrium microscopicum]|uniref:Uncharacterized protein n=1 Tax=Microthyrium microscopicum TaxID=703497 RepID=A0A6A6ULA4_9PEZI|nr:hypothetical protein BT63DRAFT_411037 [Microthyrium microscopicum]
MPNMAEQVGNKSPKTGGTPPHNVVRDLQCNEPSRARDIRGILPRDSTTVKVEDKLMFHRPVPKEQSFVPSAPKKGKISDEEIALAERFERKYAYYKARYTEMQQRPSLFSAKDHERLLKEHKNLAAMKQKLKDGLGSSQLKAARQWLQSKERNPGWAKKECEEAKMREKAKKKAKEKAQQKAQQKVEAKSKTGGSQGKKRSFDDMLDQPELPITAEAIRTSLWSRNFKGDFKKYAKSVYKSRKASPGYANYGGQDDFRRYVLIRHGFTNTFDIPNIYQGQLPEGATGKHTEPVYPTAKRVKLHGGLGPRNAWKYQQGAKGLKQFQNAIDFQAKLGWGDIYVPNHYGEPKKMSWRDKLPGPDISSKYRTYIPRPTQMKTITSAADLHLAPVPIEAQEAGSHRSRWDWMLGKINWAAPGSVWNIGLFAPHTWTG